MALDTMYKIGQIVCPILKPLLKMQITEIHITEGDTKRYSCYWFSDDELTRSGGFGEHEIELAGEE